MIEIPFSDFMGKLQLNRTSVKFSQSDPYGHMSSGQYVNLAFDHRIEVLRDQVGADPMTLLKTQKLAYFARDIRLTFLAPAATGDSLEVASWLSELTERDLENRIIVVGEKDRFARALITMRFVFVDTATNRPAAVPKTLPSTAERNLVVELDPIAPYLETVKNLPRDWKDSPVAAPPAK